MLFVVVAVVYEVVDDIDGPAYIFRPTRIRIRRSSFIGSGSGPKFNI